ncbi:MAG: LysE family translocator [Rhizobiales bacterium]|nr:LysE family translocator [Hyphomicrobiales bacterium]
MEFLPTLPVFVAFTLASVVLIITPGPDMTLFLGKTLTQGQSAGMAAMLGATAGNVVHTLLAAFGISALLAASPSAFAALKFAGAIYLLWLAFSAIRHGSALRLDRARVEARPIRQVFLTGVAINLLNPKIILFFVTFLPQFIETGDEHARGKLLFLGLYMIALALPSCAAMIIAASRIARLVQRSPLVTRVIDWLFASVFAGFAVVLLTERAEM